MLRTVLEQKVYFKSVFCEFEQQICNNLVSLFLKENASTYKVVTFTSSKNK